MYLQTSPLTVKNKHNETITVEKPEHFPFPSKCLNISSEKYRTGLVEPEFYLKANEGTEREFTLTEEQLKKHFAKLPLAEIGKSYRVKADTTGYVKIVNSRPLPVPLKKGDIIQCTRGYVFSKKDKHDVFSLGQAADGSYYGSRVYFNPEYFEPVEVEE